MTIRLFGAAALFAGAALFATAAQAAGDPAASITKGKIKSQTCLGCHGIPGYMTVYPSYPVPKLAGQHAAYIVSALKEYASGKRSFPTMHAQATALSEQDMLDIAAYFESLAKPVPGAAEKGASE